MEKRYEVTKHGEQWIDTSTPIVCPECGEIARETSHRYTHKDFLRDTFRVRYDWNEYRCDNCKCNFKDSDKHTEKTIVDIEVGKLLSLIAFIIIFIYIIISIIVGLLGYAEDCFYLFMLLFIPGGFIWFPALACYFDWT